MNDHPLAEACPVEAPTVAEPPTPLTTNDPETLYDQVIRVLPRLTSIGASVALIGPMVMLGADSYGRVGCT